MQPSFKISTNFLIISTLVAAGMILGAVYAETRENLLEQQTLKTLGALYDSTH